MKQREARQRRIDAGLLFGAALLPVAHWFLVNTHDRELAAAGLVVGSGAVLVLVTLLCATIQPIVATLLPRPLQEPGRALLFGLSLPALGVLGLALSPWVGAERVPWSLGLAAGLAGTGWLVGRWVGGGGRPRVWLATVVLATVGWGGAFLGARAHPALARVVLDKTLTSAALLRVSGDLIPRAAPPAAPPAVSRFPAPGPVGERPVERPNVLLVTIDAVRWDHTSLSGYARATTPRLADFAKRAVVFERAYSPASTTRFSSVPSATRVATWRITEPISRSRLRQPASRV